MDLLSGKRILLCGKGGSGKSTLAALLATALQNLNHHIALVDGDASNPGGLARLVVGAKESPAPLIEFFGGRNKVTCPSDDPSPLTRVSDALPVVDVPISLQEIPPRFYARSGNMLVFQVGKIRKPYEGCDGPMSKVVRDFLLDGEYITVIDMEAGVEHFGRGIEQHVDVVLVSVDPTYESFETAVRVTSMCSLMSIAHALAILNGIECPETEAAMRSAMDIRHVPVLGRVRYDPSVRVAGMNGTALGPCDAGGDMARIARDLETLLLSMGGA